MPRISSASRGQGEGRAARGDITRTSPLASVAPAAGGSSHRI